jgi:hypothetical protein
MHRDHWTAQRILLKAFTGMHCHPPCGSVARANGGGGARAMPKNGCSASFLLSFSLHVLPRPKGHLPKAFSNQQCPFRR